MIGEIGKIEKRRRTFPSRFMGEGRRGLKEKSEYDSKTLEIARVARVTRGGKRFSFRATVVVGNGKGKVGLGVAQGRDVAQAVQKAVNQAKKNLITVLIKNGTIPHEVSLKSGSVRILIKPASTGHGVKAGGPVRFVMKLAGVENISAKLIERTSNKINIARAAIEALSRLRANRHATSPTEANS